jgi:hypothetical protein
LAGEPTEISELEISSKVGLAAEDSAKEVKKEVKHVSS